MIMLRWKTFSQLARCSLLYLSLPFPLRIYFLFLSVHCHLWSSFLLCRLVDSDSVKQVVVSIPTSFRSRPGRERCSAALESPVEEQRCSCPNLPNHSILSICNSLHSSATACLDLLSCPVLEASPHCSRRR